ncbi:hypothetical protein LUZ63_002977 [Rhynchospora breviuscula]|uniref:RSE1/DDB1/CPSF1 C-terminal domain-containing protein n=1 Tax=Rhynchospora breviuscula TaxID=2022672 RepID=A0A9Q0HZE8_9POAL|nr:hypothetical protein LUZ63_002977 [Rhynchospora breviuscula]
MEPIQFESTRVFWFCYKLFVARHFSLLLLNSSPLKSQPSLSIGALYLLATGVSSLALHHTPALFIPPLLVYHRLCSSMSSSKVDLLGSSSEDSGDLLPVVRADHNFPPVDPEVDTEDEEVAFAGVCLVSVLKPSAVTHAISCHFTSSTDINLILGRGTRLEILEFKDEKLQSAAPDTLCLMTELWPRTYELRILQWNSYENRITLSDKIAIPSSFGEFHQKKICCIDQEKKLIGLLFCLRFKDHDNDHWSKLEFSDLGEIVNVEQLVDYHFSRLVPLLAHDGFIGISRRSVQLKIQDDFDSADFDHDIVASTFTINGSLLIADAAGNVYMVEISKNEEQICLKSSVVAQGTSIASALAALTDEFIFIGSSSGDSQQAAGQKIIVASGNYGDGSLRSIFHSCTFNIFGSIEMDGLVGGFWTHVEGDVLRLVYSLLGGFVAFEIRLQDFWSDDNNLDKARDVTATVLGGFDKTEMLLYVASGHCHVTSSAVILSSSSSEAEFVHHWSCPHTINVATSFEDKILVAHGEYNLTLLQINGCDFKVIGSRKMPAAVSCLNIRQDGSMVAIGMWTKVILAAFPSLSEIEELDLNNDQMIRSVLLFQFHEGRILVFRVEQGKLEFLVAEAARGPVYALQFCNNRLLATVQTYVCLYSLEEYRGLGLHRVDSRSGNIANPHGLVHLSTFGNQIVAGASIGSPYLMVCMDGLDVLIDEPINGFGGSFATICMDTNFFMSANFEELTLSCHAPHKENRWKLLGDIFIGEFITCDSAGIINVRTKS